MADMEKVSVGKLLRSRRNEPALTQRQATDQVGVTEATISRRKSGNIDNMRRDNIAGLPVHWTPLLIMVIEDTEHLYKPVNSEKLELIDDYRDVDD